MGRNKSGVMTWNMIMTEFKKTYPELKGQVIYWRPHSYATILIRLKDGREATYNCDTHKMTVLPTSWIHKED